MKKCVVLLLVAAFIAASVPVMAARTAEVQPIIHDPILLYQAYPGDSNRTDKIIKGLNGLDGDAISAVPGVFSFIPGDKWCNFVSAAKYYKPYSIKNVVLQKDVPYPIQCANKFPTGTMPVQQGTNNIRTWWPLMYELPGTTWTLTIFYGTTPAWKDPCNSVSTSVHTDVWTFKVVATPESMINELNLFHELPFGTSEVPLISDEYLYADLLKDLQGVQYAMFFTPPNLQEASNYLMDFENDVADRCITAEPSTPRPYGGDTGIANSAKEPACCKLLVDAEYVGIYSGIWAANK